MLLIIRKSIAIHGGAVVINEKGIILTGDSGAGKSTLAAAFREKGYDFLADDVSVIGEDKNYNLTIMPGYPQQKLCSDAVEKFKYSNISSIKKIDEDRDKYAIAIKNKFRKTEAKLKAIYELSVGDVETVQVRKITGTEKLNVIFNNIFRFGLVDYIGIDPIYFKKCVQLAKNIDVYKIIRPKEVYTIDEQIEIIESNMGEMVL
jgi:GTPase SAR1 family protein